MKVGSSSESFCSVCSSFSCPALVLGSIDTLMTGSGNSIDSSNTGLPSVQRVSPVPVSLGPTSAAMSPAYTSSTSVRLAACISTSLLTRSRLPLVEL